MCGAGARLGQHSCKLLLPACVLLLLLPVQMIMDWGAVPVMLQLLRNHGSIAPHASTQHIAAQHHNPEPWHEAAPLSEAARAEAEPANADDAADGAESSGSEEEEEEDGVVINAESSSYMTSGPFRAPKRASPHTPTAAAAAAGGGGGSAGGAVVPALKVVVGPELVLEQATGLACMLCHNADNHFHLVNQGLVPLLVGLLQPGACVVADAAVTAEGCTKRDPAFGFEETYAPCNTLPGFDHLRLS